MFKKSLNTLSTGVSVLGLLAVLFTAFMVTSSFHNAAADGASGSGIGDLGWDGVGQALSAHAEWKTGDWTTADDAVNATLQQNGGSVAYWTDAAKEQANKAYTDAVANCKKAYNKDCEDPRIAAIGYWKLSNDGVNNGAGVKWQNYADAWANDGGHWDPSTSDDTYSRMFNITRQMNVKGIVFKSDSTIGKNQAPSIDTRITDNSLLKD